MNKLFTLFSALVLVSFLSACSPEVGTKAWCDSMGDKPKGDWTANDASDFAKYCVLKNYKE